MTINPLTPAEIKSGLSRLPDWDVVVRMPPDADHAHTELHNIFRFSSFGEAMHYMLTASRFIHVTDHHPCWQNTYSKVEVWITTGDLKHQLSSKDFTLAHYLDALFQHYKAPV